MAALHHVACLSSLIVSPSPSLAFCSRSLVLGYFPRLSIAQTSSFHFSPLPVCAASKTEKTTTTESTVQTENVLADLSKKWDAVENKPAILAYGGGALLALWLSATVIGLINSVPVLPKVLELVGLGYAVWFVYRYLLFKESRKGLVADVEELKSKVTGEKD